MPILIALGAGASGTLAGEHAATARTSLPLGGAHVARARSLARTLRGEHASVARRGLTLRGAHRAVGLASPDAWPLALEEGQPPRDVVVSTNLLVGGAPAVVLEFRYDAAPERETLELTVAGDARDQLGRALSVTAAVGEISETYGPLESAGEYSWDATAGTTTLHAARALQAALARTQLPELIEWAGRATSPLGMSQAPRTASVGDVVRGAFAAAGAPLSIPRDTLAGQTWQEGRRDYATAGKTPGALWAESYGLVGHTLVMRAPGYVSLAPGAFIASAAPAAEGTLGAAVTAEARQVPPLPIRLTVRGADKVTPAADLIQIDTSPDPLSLDFELKRQGEWVFGPYVNGAARTWKGYRKAGGQVIAEVEFTTGDVTVRATVDGQPNVRVLRGVATGYTQSMYTYDGGCSDKLLSKITTSTSWGYGLDTVLGSFDTSGPGLYVGAPAGDLLGDERSVTTQTWSPEGYLAARLTQAHQITSLEQTAADTPAPGPLMARGYSDTTTLESWRPAGGAWAYTQSVSGDQPLPLHDADSGEAVRMGSRGAATVAASFVTDQAPPLVRCPDPAEQKLVSEPQEAVLDLGGPAPPGTLDLPFVQDLAQLAPLGQDASGPLKPRTARDVTAYWPPFVRPGDLYPPYGVVQSLSVSGSAVRYEAGVQVQVWEAEP